MFYTYSLDCLFLFKFSMCIYLSLSAFVHRYETMFQSWMHSPEDRPSFTDVAARIDKRLDDKTTEVMFNLKSFIRFKTSGPGA